MPSGKHAFLSQAKKPGFCPSKQRNRVSVVNIKVNRESEKETRFLSSGALQSELLTAGFPAPVDTPVAHRQGCGDAPGKRQPERLFGKFQGQTLSRF